MPGTPRKPAGAAGAYIVAASWLHREDQYAQKLLLVKDWESVKPIITQYPQPPTLGSLVYAVDADTADRAVEVANEKGWGTKLHGTEFTIREVTTFPHTSMLFPFPERSHCDAPALSRSPQMAEQG